jgi:hypothetical protein
VGVAAVHCSAAAPVLLQPGLCVAARIRLHLLPTTTAGKAVHAFLA